MKKFTFLMALILLAFNNINAQQITFDFETVTILGPSGGRYATETIDGVTVTATSPNNNVLLEDLEYGGTTGNSINRISDSTAEPVIFTFSEPVNVQSIIGIEYSLRNEDWTYYTTDGTNAPKTVHYTNKDGIADESPVQLNWTGVTSFTVQPSTNASLMFDKLVVSTTLSIEDHHKSQIAKVSPNPVAHSLTITNVSDLKSVRIYNTLGLEVLQSTKAHINISHLPAGLYLLKIQGSQGIETKRIIKR